MSQTPITPRTSPETIPFVFTFDDSSNTTTSGTEQPMFVFTAGTRAAQRNRNDAVPLTPETSPSLPLNDTLNDSQDGLVLSDVDSSAEQDVESDQEEKVADETPVSRVSVSRRLVVPPREIRDLRRSFRASMANISASINDPPINTVMGRAYGVIETVTHENEQSGSNTENEPATTTDNDDVAAADTEEAAATDDEEEAATEIAFESSDEDDIEDFGEELEDDTSLPINPRLFPTAQEAEIGTTTDNESATCSVCYCDLTIKNCVTALCGHTYCNKCFFRWMETNATCACCRRPFDSKTNLTDEQLSREYDECYVRYQHLLIRHNTALQESNKLFRQNIAIEERNKSLIASNIRIREMIDYSRGYNDGCVAAHDKVINGGKGIQSKCWKGLSKNTEWANGFNKAYNHEMREMKRKMHKLEKINERNQTKRRRAFESFNDSDDEEEALA